MSHQGSKRRGFETVAVDDSDDELVRASAKQQKRKRYRQGSKRCGGKVVAVDEFDDCEGLPRVILAPGSLQESFAWPFLALALFCGLSHDLADSAPSAVQQQCLERLCGIISVGICLNGNYSGIDCPSLALKMMLSAWCSFRLASFAGKVIRTYSASDVLPLCRRVLLSAREGDVANHIFGDVVDRLPAHARTQLEAWRPRIGADEVTTMLGLQEIEDLLRNPRTWPAPGRIISFCYRHNAFCPLMCDIPPAVQDVSSDEADADEEGEAQVEAAVPLADVVPGGPSSSSSALPTQRSSFRRLVWEVAGTTCKGWCPLSRTGRSQVHLGKLHPSSVPFLVWIYWCLQQLPDIILHENGYQFDENEISRRVGHMYLVVSTVLCSSRVGLPIRRPRRFTLCFLRRTVVWHGCLEHFKELFHVTARMTPDEYFTAPQSVQDRVLRAQRARFSAEPMSGDWTAALSPGHLGRLEDAMEVFGSSEGAVLDVDHNVVRIKGRAGAQQLPPLLTHGTYWHTVLQRPMVGLEHLLAQGISSGEPLHIEKHYPALQNMAEKELKFLAGNGMHVNVVGLLMQYVLCHAELKHGWRVGCGLLCVSVLFVCMFTPFYVCQCVSTVNTYFKVSFHDNGDA